MDNIIIDKYKSWLKNAHYDKDLQTELEDMTGDEEKIRDAFYKDLSFGTAGLRGIIGAGTNRMNVYTVGRATVALARYLAHNVTGRPAVAISFDSRHKSEYFAHIAAAILSRMGLKAYIYNRIMPVPLLSFAVRELHADAGIMITASHNRAEYNGYKVYGADGCQIRETAAADILGEIEHIDPFKDIDFGDFDEDLDKGNISYIDESIVDLYIEQVKKESLLSNENVDKSVSIIYTPLNGSGREPVLRVLNEQGFNNITIVKEQESPNGDFPTCPYPNPEIREAMELGLKYAADHNADLLIATDPDSDRMGTAVRDTDGNYRLLSGNEMAILLFNYICERRTMLGTMPENPIMVKTIVSTSMVEKMAAKYNVKVINVLTGFKYIGEQIDLLEEKGRADSYIFGFEESYGYLSGSYVRDKDGVNAAMLAAEMFSYYKSKGLSLLDKLSAIYDEFGLSTDRLFSYTFSGESGFNKMKEVMHSLRKSKREFASLRIIDCLDYLDGIGSLPKSDVLEFHLEGGTKVIIRPSGTEPKMKMYVSAFAEDSDKLESIISKITKAGEEIFS